MVSNTVPPPTKPERFYAHDHLQHWVMDRYTPGVLYPTFHSHYNTREEAQAVALALNTLSK